MVQSPGGSAEGDGDRARRVVMMARSDLPIVCTLTPEALEARRQGLLFELANRSEGYEQLTDGIRMRFAAASETLATLTRAVEAERQCCRFLRFSITVEPDDGPIFLELTGPEGTGEFLAALLDK
jgi:hypothetical protein